MHCPPLTGDGEWGDHVLKIWPEGFYTLDHRLRDDFNFARQAVQAYPGAIRDIGDELVHSFRFALTMATQDHQLISEMNPSITRSLPFQILTTPLIRNLVGRYQGLIFSSAESSE